MTTMAAAFPDEITPRTRLPWRLIRLWAVASAGLTAAAVSAWIVLISLFAPLDLQDLANATLIVVLIAASHTVAFAAAAAAWAWAARRSPSLDGSTARLWAFAASAGMLLTAAWLVAGVMRQTDTALGEFLVILAVQAAWYAFALVLPRYVVRTLRRRAFSGAEADAPGLPKWMRPRTFVLAYAVAWALTVEGQPTIERDVHGVARATIARVEPDPAWQPRPGHGFRRVGMRGSGHAVALAPGLIRASYDADDGIRREHWVVYYAWVPGAYREVLHDVSSTPSGWR